MCLAAYKTSQSCFCAFRPLSLVSGYDVAERRAQRAKSAISSMETPNADT